MNRRQFLTTLAAGMMTAGCATRAALPRDSRTGYVFDPVFLEHDWPDHPEGAYRLRAVMAELEASGLRAAMRSVSARPASKAEIRRAHGEWHVDELEVMSKERDPGYLDPYARDNYYNAATWPAAIRAVGGLTDLCLAVADGRLDNGYALVRPPGHHAEANKAMGFCYFGNAALAAKALKEEAGVARVTIVDFDIHHGNGTQDLVGRDPDIQFIDLHERNLFPVGSGASHETGTSAGEGSVINIPLPRMVGDQGLAALFEQVVAPAIRRVDPEFVLASAGYDGHWRDPLSHQAITLAGFDRLSRDLVALADEVCDGRVVFTLEGGYDAEALSHGVANTARGLLGRADMSDPVGAGPEATADVTGLIEELRDQHGLGTG